MADHIFPAPPITTDSAAFYAAAKEGKFTIGRCTGTGQYFWYPRPVSPFDLGPTTMEPASGKGVIYTFSVMRRVNPQFTIAYVKLDEGPTMMTSIVDCDFDTIKVGQKVSLVWKSSADGTPIPCFSPD